MKVVINKKLLNRGGNRKNSGPSAKLSLNSTTTSSSGSGDNTEWEDSDDDDSSGHKKRLSNFYAPTWEQECGLPRYTPVSERVDLAKVYEEKQKRKAEQKAKVEQQRGRLSYLKAKPSGRGGIYVNSSNTSSSSSSSNSDDEYQAPSSIGARTLQRLGKDDKVELYKDGRGIQKPSAHHTGATTTTTTTTTPSSTSTTTFRPVNSAKSATQRLADRKQARVTKKRVRNKKVQTYLNKVMSGLDAKDADTKQKLQELQALLSTLDREGSSEVPPLEPDPIFENHGAELETMEVCPIKKTLFQIDPLKEMTKVWEQERMRLEYKEAENIAKLYYEGAMKILNKQKKDNARAAMMAGPQSHLTGDYAFSAHFKEKLLSPVLSALLSHMSKKYPTFSEKHTRHPAERNIGEQIMFDYMRSKKGSMLQKELAKRNYQNYVVQSNHTIEYFKTENCILRQGLAPLYRAFEDAALEYGRLTSLILPLELAWDIPYFFSEHLRRKMSDIKAFHNQKVVEAHFQFLKAHQAMNTFLEEKIWEFEGMNKDIEREVPRIQNVLTLHRFLDDMYERNPWLHYLGTNYSKSGPQRVPYGTYGYTFDLEPELMNTHAGTLVLPIIKDLKEGRLGAKYTLLSDQAKTRLDIPGVRDELSLHLRCLNAEVQLIRASIDTLEGYMGYMLDSNDRLIEKVHQHQYVHTAPAMVGPDGNPQETVGGLFSRFFSSGGENEESNSTTTAPPSVVTIRQNPRVQDDPGATNGSFEWLQGKAAMISGSIRSLRRIFDKVSPSFNGQKVKPGVESSFQKILKRLSEKVHKPSDLLENPITQETSGTFKVTSSEDTLKSLRSNDSEVPEPYSLTWEGRFRYRLIQALKSVGDMQDAMSFSLIDILFTTMNVKSNGNGFTSPLTEDTLQAQQVLQQAREYGKKLRATLSEENTKGMQEIRTALDLQCTEALQELKKLKDEGKQDSMEHNALLGIVDRSKSQLLFLEEIQPKLMQMLVKVGFFQDLSLDGNIDLFDLVGELTTQKHVVARFVRPHIHRTGELSPVPFIGARGKKHPSDQNSQDSQYSQSESQDLQVEIPPMADENSSEASGEDSINEKEGDTRPSAPQQQPSSRMDVEIEDGGEVNLQHQQETQPLATVANNKEVDHPQQPPAHPQQPSLQPVDPQLADFNNYFGSAHPATNNTTSTQSQTVGTNKRLLDADFTLSTGGELPTKIRKLNHNSDTGTTTDSNPSIDSATAAEVPSRSQKGTEGVVPLSTTLPGISQFPETSPELQNTGAGVEEEVEVNVTQPVPSSLRILYDKVRGEFTTPIIAEIVGLTTLALAREYFTADNPFSNPDAGRDNFSKIPKYTYNNIYNRVFPNPPPKEKSNKFEPSTVKDDTTSGLAEGLAKLHGGVTFDPTTLEKEDNFLTAAEIMIKIEDRSQESSISEAADSTKVARIQALVEQKHTIRSDYKSPPVSGTTETGYVQEDGPSGFAWLYSLFGGSDSITRIFNEDLQPKIFKGIDEAWERSMKKTWKNYNIPYDMSKDRNVALADLKTHITTHPVAGGLEDYSTWVDNLEVVHKGLQEVGGKSRNYDSIGKVFSVTETRRLFFLTQSPTWSPTNVSAFFRDVGIAREAWNKDATILSTYHREVADPVVNAALDILARRLGMSSDHPDVLATLKYNVEVGSLNAEEIKSGRGVYLHTDYIKLRESTSEFLGNVKMAMFFQSLVRNGKAKGISTESVTQPRQPNTAFNDSDTKAEREAKLHQVTASDFEDVSYLNTVGTALIKTLKQTLIVSTCVTIPMFLTASSWENILFTMPTSAGIGILSAGCAGSAQYFAQLPNNVAKKLNFIKANKIAMKEKTKGYSPKIGDYDGGEAFVDVHKDLDKYLYWHERNAARISKFFQYVPILFTIGYGGYKMFTASAGTLGQLALCGTVGSVFSGLTTQFINHKILSKPAPWYITCGAFSAMALFWTASFMYGVNQSTFEVCTPIPDSYWLQQTLQNAYDYTWIGTSDFLSAVQEDFWGTLSTIFGSPVRVEVALGELSTEITKKMGNTYIQMVLTDSLTWMKTGALTGTSIAKLTTFIYKVCSAFAPGVLQNFVGLLGRGKTLKNASNKTLSQIPKDISHFFYTLYYGLFTKDSVRTRGKKCMEVEEYRTQPGRPEYLYNYKKEETDYTAAIEEFELSAKREFPNGFMSHLEALLRKHDEMSGLRKTHAKNLLNYYKVICYHRGSGKDTDQMQIPTYEIGNFPTQLGNGTLDDIYVLHRGIRHIGDLSNLPVVRPLNTVSKLLTNLRVAIINITEHQRAYTDALLRYFNKIWELKDDMGNDKKKNELGTALKERIYNAWEPSPIANIFHLGNDESVPELLRSEREKRFMGFAKILSAVTTFGMSTMVTNEKILTSRNTQPLLGLSNTDAQFMTLAALASVGLSGFIANTSHYNNFARSAPVKRNGDPVQVPEFKRRPETIDVTTDGDGDVNVEASDKQHSK